MPDNEICYLTAREIWQKISKHELSATEVMQAHLSQIESVNPKVNAIITLQPDQAMEGAKATDEAIARGEEIRPTDKT